MSDESKKLKLSTDTNWKFEVIAPLPLNSEFVKRLNEVLFVSVVHQEGKENTRFEGYTHTDVLNILKAARAEWPKDSDPKYKKLLFTNRRIALAYDRGVWFRKWFGKGAP